MIHQYLSLVIFRNFFKLKRGGLNFLRRTNSGEPLSYLVPFSVFQFQKFEGVKFLFIHRTSMGSNSFPSTSVNFLKFPQIKEGGANFLVGTNSAERLKYLVPPSVF